MDLVINHSSIDCSLIETHKNWYHVTETGELERPGAWENGKRVIWGDLATFNIENSPDKENLWNYFLNLCRHYLKMGFNGFRCDAAYQINSEFWLFLISNLKKEFGEIYFLAETLGCTPVQIQALSNCGFDYIFNSSKWWNFNDPWCLEQSELTRNIAPSISFPETHDTQRLMFESMNNEVIFLQRLYFEAIFSKGFMITTGLEYGFTKKIDTVKTTWRDWENTGLDYTKNIRRIIDIKMALKPLHEESPIAVIDQSNWMNIFCFIKTWDNVKVLVIMNKDINRSHNLFLNNLNNLLGSDKIKDYSPENKLTGYIKELNIQLKPGELKIFASENHYNS
jgi:starch synthase (maltosyl-transferring)